MKKMFLLLALCCAMVAHAGTYKYLVFTNSIGTTTAFSVTNLILKVEGQNLKVTHQDGTSELLLTDILSMEFSMDGTTALENVLNADAPVEVYNFAGTYIGRYASMVELVGSLSPGTYVMTNGKQSQIIMVK